MALRTDRDRFLDRRYVSALLSAYLGLDGITLDASQKAQANEEMRQFGEYYKGVLDIVNNLVAMGVQARSVHAFFLFAKDTFGDATSVRVLFQYTLELTTATQKGGEWIAISRETGI